MQKYNFISVEGIDGSGKSTAINVIKDYFESNNKPCVIARWSDDPSVGRVIKRLLQNNQFSVLHVDVQAMLMASAVRNMIYQTILPALEEDKIVIADRYTLSARVYQSDSKDIEYLCANSEDIVSLDVVFYLDVDVDTSTDRIKERNLALEDLENVSTDVLTKRKDKYEQILGIIKPSKLFIIDANMTIDKVKSQIVKCLRSLYTN